VSDRDHGNGKTLTPGPVVFLVALGIDDNIFLMTRVLRKRTVTTPGTAR
jgi:hypothetical protein